MTEAQLWEKHRIAMGQTAGFAGVRVEAGSGEVAAGTPDLVLTWAWTTRWVELKVWPEPINKWQRAWAMERDLRRVDTVLVLAGVRDVYWLGRWVDYDQGEIGRGWSVPMLHGPGALWSPARPRKFESIWKVTKV